MTPQSNRFGRKSHETPEACEILAGINRPLPWSEESEKGVISAILNEPGRMRSIRNRLNQECFYGEHTQAVYLEMLTMDEKGEPIELIGLTNRLRDQGRLDKIGGAAFLTELFTFVPAPSHVELYATDVLARWRQRQAIHGYALALQTVFDHGPNDEVSTTINAAQQTAQAFIDNLATCQNTTATLHDCLLEHLEHMEALQERIQSGNDALIPTGIPSLDRNCGGIALDEYWLVTGPTKSGKSVLTGCIATHAARRGFVSKVYTNEIGRRTYAGRILASAAEHIDGGMERKGLRNRQEMDAYMKAMKSLQTTIGKTLKIDSASGKYVEDLVADMRAEAEQGTKLFIVDLIGKLRSRQRFDSRERELAHISLSLFEATKNYKVACIAVAQENDDGRIRESRALEMDCEAWIRVCHVLAAKSNKGGQRGFGKSTQNQDGGHAENYVLDRRNLVVELARGFAAGDKIPCLFNGARFMIRELTQADQDNRHWTED